MRANKTGITLIELMVVLLIGALLASVVWALFGGSSRHSRGIDERLTAIQAAQAVIEHLRYDLKAAIVTSAQAMHASTEEGKPTLDFVATDPAKPCGYGSPVPGSRKVTYQFDPVEHRVTRNGKPIGTAAFEKVEFEYVRGNVADPFATASPSEGPEANCLRYRITAAAPTLLERIEDGQIEEGDRRGRITLAGAVRIEAQTYREQFPGWTEHAFETPMPMN